MSPSIPSTSSLSPTLHNIFSFFTVDSPIYCSLLFIHSPHHLLFHRRPFYPISPFYLTINIPISFTFTISFRDLHSYHLLYPLSASPPFPSAYLPLTLFFNPPIYLTPISSGHLPHLIPLPPLPLPPI